MIVEAPVVMTLHELRDSEKMPGWLAQAHTATYLRMLFIKMTDIIFEAEKTNLGANVNRFQVFPGNAF